MFQSLKEMHYKKNRRTLQIQLLNSLQKTKSSTWKYFFTTKIKNSFQNFFVYTKCPICKRPKFYPCRPTCCASKGYSICILCVIDLIEKGFQRCTNCNQNYEWTEDINEFRGCVDIQLHEKVSQAFPNEEHKVRKFSFLFNSYKNLDNRSSSNKNYERFLTVLFFSQVASETWQNISAIWKKVINNSIFWKIFTSFLGVRLTM